MVEDLLKNLTDIEQASSMGPSSPIFGYRIPRAQTYVPKDITEERFVGYWQGIID